VLRCAGALPTPVSNNANVVCAGQLGPIPESSRDCDDCGTGGNAVSDVIDQHDEASVPVMVHVQAKHQGYAEDRRNGHAF
jgi:hypothetical protein